MELSSQFCNICYMTDTDFQNITVENGGYTKEQLVRLVGNEDIINKYVIYLCPSCCELLEHFDRFREMIFKNLICFRQMFFELKSKLEVRDDPDLPRKLRDFLETQIYDQSHYDETENKCSISLEDQNVKKEPEDIDTDEPFDTKENIKLELETSEISLETKIKQEIESAEFENNIPNLVAKTEPVDDCENVQIKIEVEEINENLPIKEELHTELNIQSDGNDSEEFHSEYDENDDLYYQFVKREIKAEDTDDFEDNNAEEHDVCKFGEFEAVKMEINEDIKQEVASENSDECTSESHVNGTEDRGNLTENETDFSGNQVQPIGNRLARLIEPEEVQNFVRQSRAASSSSRTPGRPPRSSAASKDSQNLVESGTSSSNEQQYVLSGRWHKKEEDNLRYDSFEGPPLSRDERFKCKKCDKVLKSNSHLVDHQRIHTGDRPYKCDVCGKTFNIQSNLTIHKRIHSGYRPYKCKDCDKTFIQLSTLTSHARIHDDVRPFRCARCEKAFTNITSLKKHQTKHFKR